MRVPAWLEVLLVLLLAVVSAVAAAAAGYQVGHDVGYSRAQARYCQHGESSAVAAPYAEPRVLGRTGC
jgi:alcohol dehydrogenase class IV